MRYFVAPVDDCGEFYTEFWDVVNSQRGETPDVDYLEGFHLVVELQGDYPQRAKYYKHLMQS